MAAKYLQTGLFINPDTSYYATPLAQQVNDDGDIIGDTHFVVQRLDLFTSTEVLDPTVFASFKGVADENGTVVVNLTSGLPGGTYKVASINAGGPFWLTLLNIARSMIASILVSTTHIRFFG